MARTGVERDADLLSSTVPGSPRLMLGEEQVEGDRNEEAPVRDGSNGRGRGMLMFTGPRVGPQWTFPWPGNAVGRGSGDPRSPSRVREEFEDAIELETAGSPKRARVQEVPDCGREGVEGQATAGTLRPLRIPAIDRLLGGGSRQLNVSLNGLSTSFFDPGGSQQRVTFDQLTDSEDHREAKRRERAERKRVREQEAKENVERRKEYDRLEQSRRQSQAELQSLDAQCGYINEQLNQLAAARDSCKDDNMALRYRLEYEERELEERMVARRIEAEMEGQQFEADRLSLEQEHDHLRRCTTELMAERSERLRQSEEMGEYIRNSNEAMLNDRDVLVSECARLETRRSMLEAVLSSGRDGSSDPVQVTGGMGGCAASTPKKGILKRGDYDPFVSDTAHDNVSDGVYRRRSGIAPGGGGMGGGSAGVGWNPGGDSSGTSDLVADERWRQQRDQNEVQLRQLQGHLTDRCRARLLEDAEQARALMGASGQGPPTAAEYAALCNGLLQAAHANGTLPGSLGDCLARNRVPQDGIPPPAYQDISSRGIRMGENRPRGRVAAGSNDPDPGGDPNDDDPPPRRTWPRRNESGQGGSGGRDPRQGGAAGGSGGAGDPGGGNGGGGPPDDDPDPDGPRQRKRPTRRSSMSARMQDHYENNPAIRDLGLDCYSRGADGSDVVDWSVKQVNRLRHGRMNAARMVAVVPKPYDGSRAWKDWFADFTDDMESNGWGPREALQQLLRCLREGPGKIAKDRWRRKYGAEGTYEQLVECASYALCHLVSADPMVAFRKRTQKPHESHRAFGLELQNLLERAKPNADFDDVDFLDELFSHFVQGLRDEQQAASAERAWTAEASLTDLFMAVETHNKKQGLLAGKVSGTSGIRTVDPPHVRTIECADDGEFEIVELEEEDGSISVVRLPVGNPERTFVPRKVWTPSRSTGAAGAGTERGTGVYARRQPWTALNAGRPAYPVRSATTTPEGDAKKESVPKSGVEKSGTGGTGLSASLTAELVEALVKQLRDTLSTPRLVDRATVRCFRCQQLGHYAGDCVAPLPAPRAAAVEEGMEIRDPGN